MCPDLTVTLVNLQPNAPDKEGSTPIEVAKESGRDDIVKLLAAFGAKARFKGAIRSVMKMKGGVDKWKLAAAAAEGNVADSSAMVAEPAAAAAEPSAEPGTAGDELDSIFAAAKAVRTPPRSKSLCYPG